MSRFLLGSLNCAGSWFHAKGEGLTTCELNEDTGDISQVHVCAGAENIIWMASAGNRLWTATERYEDPGEVSAYRLNEEFIPSRIGAIHQSNGGAICHIGLTPNNDIAFVSGYFGGISAHRIGGSGEIAAAHQSVNYHGSGPNAERQEKSHPHQATVSADGTRLYVCDLGSDRVWIHSIENGSLGEARGISMPAGTGPRHLVIHPTLPLLYVLGELDGRVHLCEIENQGLIVRASHDSLPPGFTGTPSGAAIKFHPSGRSLLVSNRNCNTFTLFSVDSSGDLVDPFYFPSYGETPRDFAISPSGRWVLALNQDSHSVAPIELNPANGMPSGLKGQLFACGSPFCAVFPSNQ